MLLECNHETLTTLLDLFNSGKIATLSIKKTDDGSGHEKLVMDYSLVSEYPEGQQKVINNLFSNLASYPKRIKVAELLNELIKYDALKAVVNFDLEFSAAGRTSILLNSFTEYGKSNDEENNINIEECSIEGAMSVIEREIIDRGIKKTVIPNIFTKTGTGRNRKETKITVSDLFEIMKNLFTEE